jgi:FMN phosphatase YigB (HAD superfamily)
MNSSTKLLKQYIAEVIAAARTPHKKLWIFDFDDTLVRTDAKVHVTEPDGTTFDLSSGEFAIYEKRPGQTFDYTDFQKLINPRVIKWTNRILRNIYAYYGPDNIVILSARSSREPIIQFLHDIGLPGIEVVALNNADPLAKATWIDARIKRDGLKEIEFLDDSYENVASVRKLQLLHPEVKIVARHVAHN